MTHSKVPVHKQEERKQLAMDVAKFHLEGGVTEELPCWYDEDKHKEWHPARMTAGTGSGNKRGEYM